MRESSNARFVSLLLALGVMVAGWLLFEYSNQPMQKVSPPQTRPDTSISKPDQVRQPQPSQAVPMNTPSQSNVVLTFKCENAGRVGYGDKPCSANEKTLAITANEKTSEAGTGSNLDQLKGRLASLESARLERERNQEAVRSFSPVAEKMSNLEYVCQQIDKEIAYIDSRMRQPYSAQEGDQLKDRRKQLTDKRFSIGC